MDESSSSNQTNLNSHPQKGPSKRLLATLIVILSIAVLVLVFLPWQQSQSTDSQLKTIFQGDFCHIEMRWLDL